MSWQKIVLLCFFGLSSLSSIYMVGKPRKTTRPEEAIWIVLFNAALAALVVLA